MGAAEDLVIEPRKPRSSSGDDSAIRNDVASFAATLGFSSSAISSGFDDRDFRKKGPLSDRNDSGEKEKGTSISRDRDSKKGAKVKDGRNRQKKLRGSENESKGENDHVRDGRKKNNKHEGKNTGPKKNQWQKVKDMPPASNLIEAETKTKAMGKSLGVKSVSWRSGDSNASLLPPVSWYAALSESLNALLPVEESWTVEPSQRDDWEAVVEAKKKEGLELLQLAKESHDRSRASDSDARWLATARQSGTTADRIAAMTVLIQDDPVANFRSLDTLLGMATTKGGKRHTAISMDALRELFLTNLLPDRKLKNLFQQPLHRLPPGEPGRRILLLWVWEDFLKERYDRFMGALEEASKDPLSFLKEKALKAICELLKGKPEQERRLLSALINKLGDPERKVASTAGFYLGQLLTAHPNMKRIVVQEADLFVFRPHVGLRAQYYAAVFLNQIVLSNKGDGPIVARQLIDLYFALFKMVTSVNREEGSQKGGKEDKNEMNGGWRQGRAVSQAKKLKRGKNAGQEQKVEESEVDSRLLAALLTGINRAFPFVAADDVERVIQEHTPSLFRMVHASSFNLGVQALMLLQQILAAQSAVSARFYRAIYAVLLSPALSKSSKAAMFLSILFKAMKSDLDSARIAAMAKRLLQVSLQQPPAFACGALMLVSEVLKVRPILWKHVLQPEDHDEDVEHFVDILEGGGSISNEETAEKEGAGIEKEEGEDEQEEEFSGEKIDMGIDVDSADDEDLDELNGDKRGGIDKEKMANRKGSGKTKAEPSESQQIRSVKKQNLSRDIHLEGEGVNLLSDGPLEPGGKHVSWPTSRSYDVRHRDPAFCRADRASWWELQAMAAHAHPSVAAMARTLLAGSSISYGGDPLRDLTLGVFLDRLAEKKPKSHSKGREGEEETSAVGTRGGSLMQPTLKGAKSEAKAPIGSVEFATLAESEVAAEDAFFHRFYSAKAELGRKKKGKAKEDGEGSDVEESGDEVDGGTDVDRKKAKLGKDEFGDEIVGGDESEDEDIEAFLEGEMAEELGMSGEDDDMEDGDLESDLDIESEDAVNDEQMIQKKSRKGSKDTKQTDEDPVKKAKKKKSGTKDTVTFMDFGDEPSENEEDIMSEDDGKETRKKDKRGTHRNGLGGDSKRRKLPGASPFASAEEYAHLM